jgi:serine protease inhibitor
MAKGRDPDIVEVVKGNNEFALKMYLELSKQDGNIIYSPYSISTAIAMTYGGARGNTDQQMKDAMRFPFGQDKLHLAYGKLFSGLNKRGGKGDFELVTANRLWVMHGYKYNKNFIGLSKKHYGSGLEIVDFSDPVETSSIINEWVAKNTKDKINKLVGPLDIDPGTRLALTNAVYFKGQWENSFNKNATTNSDFHVTKEKTVKAEMMRQTSDFRYGDFKNVKVLEMPYKGDDICMLVILPAEIDGLANFEKSIDPDILSMWMSVIQKREVRVWLPRFKSSDEFVLNDVLGTMGMTDAFDPVNADFSGITTSEKLCISLVKHKAFIDVNEEGTEAAAATFVGMKSPSASMPTIFMADHPFFYMILDRQSGSILFMGRVVDPSIQ